MRDELARLREELRRAATAHSEAWDEIRRLREEVKGLENLRALVDRDATRDATIARLREALERDAAVLDMAQAIMRKHGFKFETPLHLSGGFEKLAFTFYTLLAEVDANARRVLEREVSA